MPNHNYVCLQDGAQLNDQYRSVEEGGRARPPYCPTCGALMAWVWPRVAMDLRSDGEGKSGNTFQKFTVRDGLNRLVEIDSLRKLREVESESEKLAADGIGQPIRFRAFAQDRSNMGVNTFGDGPDRTLTPEAKAKFGLQNGAGQVAAGEDGSDPSYEYGPGVDDTNTSALQID